MFGGGKKSQNVAFDFCLLTLLKCPCVHLKYIYDTFKSEYGVFKINK